MSGYAFGIIPATKHSLFGHRKVINWVGLDNHFAWGLGIESSIHLWVRQSHHIDLLTDADVTILASRKGIAWINNNTIYEPYQIELCANQLYKIRSSLAYHFKYFMSDVGIQYFYMPKSKYATATNITSKKILEPTTHWSSLFCDIGTAVQIGKVPSYATLGAQVTECNYKFDAWSTNLKLGITF